MYASLAQILSAIVAYNTSEYDSNVVVNDKQIAHPIAKRPERQTKTFKERFFNGSEMSWAKEAD